jgi:hypothetical protein
MSSGGVAAVSPPSHPFLRWCAETLTKQLVNSRPGAPLLQRRKGQNVLPSYAFAIPLALLLTFTADAGGAPDFAGMARSGALKWVWHKNPGEAATTDAPQGKVPDRAEFIFGVDNSADVFVNGQRLGSFGGWNPLAREDIAPLLQPGRNVIAVEADNAMPSPAGFLAMVEMPGHPPVLFDGNTKSSAAAEGAGDWTDPDFDDAVWASATALTPADGGPWGRVSGPVANPTKQNIPENIPTFAVPGFEKEMDQMRQILFGHYRLDLSTLPAFNIQWVAPAAIWAALDASPADSHTRASLRARLLSMRVMKDGYVSSHQHEGLGHSEGWPFPLYTQTGGAGWMFSTVGMPYGPEFNVHPAKSLAGWNFHNARVLGLDPKSGLSLTLGSPDATMTSPPIDVEAPAATWVRLKFIPGTGTLRPFIQWTTKEHPDFSDERKVAFEVPEGVAPGRPVDVDVPIHPVTRREGSITRLRIGFGNTGPDELTILRFFTSVDTRHNWNNANFVLAAATYFNWTGDVDFLREFIGTLRRIFRYSMEEFSIREHGVIVTPWSGKDGRPGMTLDAEGNKVIRRGQGSGTNYWDLLPFGGRDSYSTIYQFAAVRAMEQLEAAIAAHPDWKIPAPDAEYSAERLSADLEQMQKAYGENFWNPDKGRFTGSVDADGKAWDYGFTFLNNEAMYYGLSNPGQDRQIVDWISGAREIEGETSTGADIYRWRFGPRSTTLRNLDYYSFVWPDPEKIPFGWQVQDGGSVFGFSFHDLMARLRVNGPDDAWQRLKEVLAWYGDVQAAGGYRKYYAADKADERGTLQGGGPPGGLGIDEEFHETLLVPLIMTEGFLGLQVTPDRIRFAPQLPKAWPSLEVGGIQYRDWILRAKATRESLELDLQADAEARPIKVDLGPGRWEVKLLGAENRVLGEQTVGEGADAFVSIEDPATKRLVAVRMTP